MQILVGFVMGAILLSLTIGLVLEFVSKIEPPSLHWFLASLVTAVAALIGAAVAGLR